MIKSRKISTISREIVAIRHFFTITLVLDKEKTAKNIKLNFSSVSISLMNVKSLFIKKLHNFAQN